MMLAPLFLAALLHASPEVAMTTPVANASPSRENVIDVAVDGGTALVTWDDGAGTRGARFSRDGRRLNAVRYNELRAIAGANGRWFAVALRDDVLTGRFIDEEGGDVSAPIVLAPIGGEYLERLELVTDGTSFLAAWTNWGGAVHAVHIDANGRPGARIDVGEAMNTGAMDAAAFEDGFAIAWGSPQRTLEVLRLDGSGRTVARERLAELDRDPRYVEAVADGDELVTAWMTQPFGSELTLLREDRPPQRMQLHGMVPHDLVLIGGTVYVVAASATQAQVRIVSEDGTRSRTWSWPGSEVAGLEAASFGDRAIVALTVVGNDRDSRDLYTFIANEQLEEIGNERVAVDPAAQQHPAIARGANGQSLAAWVEVRGNDEVTLTGMLLDANGRPIGNPIAIAAMERPSLDPAVHVASDGTDYLVVWQAAREVRMRRVGRDGTLGETVPVGSGRADSSSACATWTGSEYVVGWIEQVASHRFNFFGRVHATTVSRGGSIAGDAPIADLITDRRFVACAAGRSSTFFVWRELDGLHGAVRMHDGAVSGSFAVEWADYAAIAANGDTFAVAWASRNRTIERAIVSAHGIMSRVNETPLPYSDLELHVAPVALAPFGSGWLLAWGTGDLRALALDANGRADGRVTISAMSDDERAPAIAGGDVPIVLYMRGDRVFSRTVTAGAQPPRRRSVAR